MQDSSTSRPCCPLWRLEKAWSPAALVAAPASLPVATANDAIGNALYVGVTIAAIEVSLVDHAPEEILVATATGLTLDYAAGIGPDCNFISLRAGANGVQIDDQLATSRFPVVLTPAAVDSNEGGVAQPLLQTCVVCQPGSAQGQVRTCPAHYLSKGHTCAHKHVLTARSALGAMLEREGATKQPISSPEIPVAMLIQRSKRITSCLHRTFKYADHLTAWNSA